MRCKLLFEFLFVVILLTNINASITEITIKSLANSNIQIITLQEGSQPGLIERLDLQTDQYGDAIGTFSTDEATYRLASSLYLNEKLIMEGEPMAGLIPGENIYLELLPEGFLKLQNPAKLNTTNITENETIELNETEIISNVSNEEQNSTVTGFAISENLISNSLTWIIIIAIILGIGGAFFVKKKKKSKKRKEIKITKLSDKKKEEENDKKKEEDELKEAEEKLEELQKTIKKLKEQKEKSPKQIEIDRIKQRMIEDEKKLMALRKEE